jgi:hypothetical protein
MSNKLEVGDVTVDKEELILYDCSESNTVIQEE